MNVRALVAEALGTFTLVGVGSLGIVSIGVYQGLPPILTVPFAFGLALMAAFAMFGSVSGGHFNPAVTLAAWIDRRVDLPTAIGYVIAQLGGAVVASFMILVLFNRDAVDATRNVPPDAVGDLKAFVIEAILTAIFVTVILTVSKNAPKLAPFLIGLTLVLIHFAAIPLTGASVNPVRSLAPAIVAGNYQHLWVYLTAPFAGAIVAWLVFRLMDSGADLEDAELESDDFRDYGDEDSLGEPEL
jgi:aquaporin Z